MSKKKNSSGLDKVIAGVVSIFALILFSIMFLNEKSTESFIGSMILVILLTIFVCFGTLEMLRTETNVELHNEKLELERLASSEFIKNSKSIADESFVATYLGGSGTEHQEKDKVLLGCTDDFLYIGNLEKLKNTTVPIAEITLFEISGDGTVTTNAGVLGGGLGIEGFIKGAIVAELLNKATTKSTTNTFVRIMTNGSEMYFHTSEREPVQLKILFSKVFVFLNSLKNTDVASSAQTTSISDELAKLHTLFKEGVLTEAEFEQAKKRIISR